MSRFNYASNYRRLSGDFIKVFQIFTGLEKINALEWAYTNWTIYPHSSHFPIINSRYSIGGFYKSDEKEIKKVI